MNKIIADAVIETGVPLVAAPKAKKPVDLSHPIHKLEVDQSFSVPKRFRNRLQTMSYVTKKSTGKQFKVMLDHKNPDNVRVYRIA